MSPVRPELKRAALRVSHGDALVLWPSGREQILTVASSGGKPSFDGLVDANGPHMDGRCNWLSSVFTARPTRGRPPPTTPFEGAPMRARRPQLAAPIRRSRNWRVATRAAPRCIARSHPGRPVVWIIAASRRARSTVFPAGGAYDLELLAQPGCRVHRVRDTTASPPPFSCWTCRGDAVFVACGDRQAVRPCPSLARTPHPCATRLHA